MSNAAEAERIRTPLRACQEEVFLGGSRALANLCRLLRMGGSGHRGCGCGAQLSRKKVGPGHTGRDSGLLHASPSTSGWSHRGGLAAPSPEWPGLPGAKTEALGRDRTAELPVSPKDLPETLRAPGVAPQGSTVCQRVGGGMEGPQTPKGALGSRKAWSEGGRGSVPPQKW